MKKCFIFVLLTMLFVACSPQVTHEAVVPTSTPVDVTSIVDQATYLAEERTYFVTLKFKKVDPFNPFSIENELKATYETIVVGQKTYDDWAIGQEISSQFDSLGLLFNGDFSSYTVTVNAKEYSSEYFWKNSQGQAYTITADEYNTSLVAISSSKTVLTVPYSGFTSNYVLKKPLSEYTFSNPVPLNRYFLQILVKNETLTIDFTKMLRNAATTHHIIVEVSKDAYDEAKDGELWVADYNTGSIVFSGRLSQLHGYVEQRWMEEDLNFYTVTVDGGQEMVIPSSLLQK